MTAIPPIESWTGKSGYHICRVLDTCKAVFLGRAKGAPESGRKKTAKDTVAYEAVKRIGAIYHLDNQLSDLEPDDRKKQRQITVRPLVEAFFAWVKEVGVSNRLPKGKTLEGINYCINQEETLKVFLNDGEVPAR